MGCGCRGSARWEHPHTTRGIMREPGRKTPAPPTFPCSELLSCKENVWCFVGLSWICPEPVELVPTGGRGRRVGQGRAAPTAGSSGAGGLVMGGKGRRGAGWHSHAPPARVLLGQEGPDGVLGACRSLTQDQERSWPVLELAPGGHGHPEAQPKLWGGPQDPPRPRPAPLLLRGRDAGGAAAAWPQAGAAGIGDVAAVPRGAAALFLFPP